uniref:Reverse transcriptase Ty1/copia-type domain-containing protein n=1 Tax=Trichogramma kaykai TaxID=54128 RepID=A0ABD2VYX3_9HYME
MYLAVATLLDIMHSVVFLSQFNTSYGKEHWNAAKRIVKYPKNTIDLCLVYSKGDFNITGFVDADWSSNALDRKSFTGYLFKLNNSIITWKTQKQKTVALSSAEAEYMALSEGCKELIFLKNLLSELGLVPKLKIFNDNHSN